MKEFLKIKEHFLIFLYNFLSLPDFQKSVAFSTLHVDNKVSQMANRFSFVKKLITSELKIFVDVGDDFENLG